MLERTEAESVLTRFLEDFSVEEDEVLMQIAELDSNTSLMNNQRRYQFYRVLARWMGVVSDSLPAGLQNCSSRPCVSIVVPPPNLTFAT